MTLTAAEFHRAEADGRLLEAVVTDWLAGYTRFAGPWRLRPYRLMACAALEPDRDGAPLWETERFNVFVGRTLRAPLWPGGRFVIWWYRRVSGMTDHQRAKAIERADLLLIRAVRLYQRVGMDDHQIVAYLRDHLLPFLAQRDEQRRAGEQDDR